LYEKIHSGSSIFSGNRQIAGMEADEFDIAVQRVMDGLPEWVHEALENVEISILEEADDSFGPDAHELLGLYDGIPLPERSVSDSGDLPDVIYLFRQPHRELGLPREELIELTMSVKSTVRDAVSRVSSRLRAQPTSSVGAAPRNEAKISPSTSMISSARLPWASRWVASQASLLGPSTRQTIVRRSESNQYLRYFTP